MSSTPVLAVQLLGPLEVSRGREPMALPRSKKTRALLGYLVATGRSHRRERLTSLLWDVTDDPRAALRWSLSKLRGLLDDDAATRLVADRETVSFEPHGADVDVYALRRVIEGHLDEAPVVRLEQALARFRGAFLEGIELDDFSEFQAFLVAERSRWQAVRVRLLRALVDRLASEPEAALVHARELVRLDDEDESAWARLVRLLFVTGRRDEAEEHQRLGLNTLKRAGQPLKGELTSTWQSLRAPAVSGTDPVAAATPLRQTMRFCTARDGARIAYATVGEGPPLLKAANWLSHLEYDWKSPIWRHLARDLSREHLLVRYDQRGNGLSDWEVADISFDAFVSDLEAVADAASLDRFALLGISQGSRTAVAYAVRHPERVSHLILYGGSARGWQHRTPEQLERRQALATLMRQGWGSDNPAFRQLFTTLFMPDATAEQVAWFNELQQVSCSAAMASRITEVSGQVDIVPLLERVRVPTLVLHATRDAMVPFDEGRRLAAGIPEARFVPLDSPNHLLLGEEPAWKRFFEETRAFLAEPG